MYTYIEEEDGYMIVDAEGQYMCYTDTEDKADLILNLLNESMSDFESGNYSIFGEAADEEIACALKSMEVRK